MPKKIRELIAELESAGFENRGGKGKLGDDAKQYQERSVQRVIEESKS